jgi:RNA polymerase sigma factor (sigma-70 family)
MTPRRLIEPARLAGAAVLRTQSDERLVDLVRDGNEGAFEAIVHRYRRPLLRYCGRFLTQPRAEDAVQQAFVNAFGALRSGDAAIQLRPWLYRIAHNSALNVLRQAGADHLPMSDEIDGVETPPQALERGERLRAVVAAVRELPDRQRNALVLQALEGRSYDEIAVELGVSDGAVRQLLNRARTTLREGATALTPTALLTRLAGTIDTPVAERVAQVVTGAGGGAALVKGVTALAVAGAALGGAAGGVLPGGGDRTSSDHPAAVAGATGATADRSGSGTASGTPADVSLLSGRRGGGSGPSGPGRRSAGSGGAGTRDGHGHGGSSQDGGDGRSGNDQGGSHDGGGSGEDHSGSGSSGGGSGGESSSGEHHSGHSGGDDGSGGGGHSGSGGDDSGSGGSGGSGSSGSGDDDSGSGSGSSGPGGGDPLPAVTVPGDEPSGSGTSGRGSSGGGSHGDDSGDEPSSGSGKSSDG